MKHWGCFVVGGDKLGCAGTSVGLVCCAVLLLIVCDVSALSVSVLPRFAGCSGSLGLSCLSCALLLFAFRARFRLPRSCVPVW